MHENSRVPHHGVPNEGQGVSDETEPEEEYELNQVVDERDDHSGQSLAESLADEPPEDDGP